MTEDELVRLLIRERSMILGYAQSIVGSYQLAEDIYQETAVVVLKKGIEIDQLERPKAWFRKIARLQAMNLIRKKKPGSRIGNRAFSTRKKLASYRNLTVDY